MSSSLNYWRRFFKTTKHDIFETIVSAIHVAATDYPEEFKDKQEYLKQTICTALSSNLLQCILSEDTYNTKPKRKNRRKEKIIDEIFNKAKMNFVENWSSDDDGGGGGGGNDDDDNACISDWMKKKSEKKERKRKGKCVVKDINVGKRCDWRAKEPIFSSFPTFSSFTKDPFFSSFPTFSSFTKEPTFSSLRAKDAHTETGSSNMGHMPNTFGTSNDGSATNLVAKEVTEVAKEPTFSSFTKDPRFSSLRAKDTHTETGSSSTGHVSNTFGTSNDGSATNLVAKEVAEVAKEPTFNSFTKEPRFSSLRAKDAHIETGSSSMGHMPNTFGTSNDGSATNLVAKEVAEVAKEPTFSSFTKDPIFSSFPTFSSFTKEPIFSSWRAKDAHTETGSSSMGHMHNTFGTSNDGSARNLVAKEVAEVAKEPTFSSFTNEPTFSSWRAKDAHTETGSSSMGHMPNTFGTSNDGSATNLVAKEVAEVAKKPTFSSFTKDPIFSSFPTFSSFTKEPTFSSWRAKDAHTETGSSSMGHMPNTFGTSDDGSAANLVTKEVAVEVGVGVGVERNTLTKKSDLLEDVSKIRDALMKLKGQPVIAYDLLMQLDKMDISAHVLKVTEIATIVSSYAKDGYCSDSSQIRLLASCLLESWSIILDKWLDNSNCVRDNEKVTVATEVEKVTVATKIVEPKSIIEETRTGSLQFHEGPSKPQSSRQIFDIGSRGSTNARCMVAGQPAERYKNRQLTSRSQVQIGSSSRANNNTSLKSQPRYGLHQGPKLTIKENPNAKNKMEVPAPTKKIEEVNRVRESLEIARRKVQERFQKSKPDARCMVTCQPAERHHFKNRQLTVSSQVQIGGSSKAYGNTSFKSQPRYGLQGPKFAVKESLDDAKNKLKGPAPADKIKEDPIRESLELAKRKLQERLQKSEQGDAITNCNKIN